MSCVQEPTPRWSALASKPSSSVIRDLLKLPAGVISFAGGLPSPEGFPLEDIAKACQTVIAKEGKHALQYSMVEGEIALPMNKCRLFQAVSKPWTSSLVFS